MKTFSPDTNLTRNKKLNSHQTSNISHVIFLSRFPSVKKIQASIGKPFFKKAFVICDKKLKSGFFLKTWLKDPLFSFYFISSGETTKSLEKLPDHLKKIQKLNQNYGRDHLLFISLGGGSVGDLTGFISSIYKRGVPLIHIPTTWLAALDSAHGGKNALNVFGVKNVLGTYHFPRAVFIVKEVLQTLPLNQKQLAFGELLKIALIEGGKFYRSLKQHSNWQTLPWETFLKKGIASKMKIVQKDPFEKKSLRSVLNFGHTIGHILEAVFSLPHGQAVMEGMLFSMRWSAKKNLLTKKNLYALQSLMPKKILTPQRNQIPISLFKKLLKQDKKYKSPSFIDFVFIRQPGSVIVKKVTEKAILQEAQRQGLVERSV